jgi:small multidrug resistance family-3 protein
MVGTTTTMITLILVTLSLFFAAAIAEIGGGYLVWSWIRKKKRLVVALVGGAILFIYGIIPTLQPSNFGRVYAAYGGIFIVFSILWGVLIDKKKPDIYEIIGSFIVLAGALIIYYAPRSS